VEPDVKVTSYYIAESLLYRHSADENEHRRC